MPRFDYFQLDVFAHRRGGGNPLGVVVDADGWTNAAMQAFAHWTNLVETTFVLPPTTGQADYKVRIFTPHKEIPFAGHPSIGTAHALLEARPELGYGRLVQECGAGLLPIRIERRAGPPRLFVQAPASAPAVVSAAASKAAESLLGPLERGAIPLACIEGGRRWWVAELASETQLRQWRPNHGAIAELATATNTLGLCVFARSRSWPDEIVVRAFPAGVGIVEDPASGAANGLIAAWIAHCEPNGPLARGYRVSQGREIGHDARIDIVIDGTGVWVGGITHTIIRGQLDWEHQP